MLLTKPGSNKKAEVCTDCQLNEVIDFFSGSFTGDEERIDKALLQFIGENLMDFKTIISSLTMQQSNAKWLKVAKVFPMYSNTHEIALRKIEEKMYYDIKPDESIRHTFQPDDPIFIDIDQFTFGLDEEELIFLHSQLMLPQRVPKYDEYDMERQRYRRPVEAPISWGRSHTEYWRAFPTSLTLYAAACALCKINKDKYEKLLIESEDFFRKAYRIYQRQMTPETGP